MTDTRERRITYDELRYILIACPTVETASWLRRQLEGLDGGRV